MTNESLTKILLMGLASAGKSSIFSIAFEGKSPDEVKNYEATVNYSRSTHNIVNNEFQVFDLGGQESFISNFVGELAEFIFSGVQIIIWVVDTTDSQHISTSKFYFDKAIEKLFQFSKQAVIFCLFHKIDLIKQEKENNILSSLKDYFSPKHDLEIYFYSTSIYDNSIYSAIGKILQMAFSKNIQETSLRTKVISYMKTTETEIFAIILLTTEGVPILEKGTQSDKFTQLINSQFSIFKQLQSQDKIDTIFYTRLVTESFSGIFKKLKSNLFIGVIGSNEATLTSFILNIDNLI